MNKLEIKKCVGEIIDALYDRGGFDDWWNNIDDGTENEIIKQLETIIENRLNKDDRSMSKLIESNKRFDEKNNPKKDDRDSYEGGFDSSMWLSTI